MTSNRIDEEEDSEIDDEQPEQEGFIFSHVPLDAVVDLRLSSSRLVDESLLKKGYVQLLPDVRSAGYSVAADSGTFGRGQSLWVWRNKQGSAGGRLRPIVDILLTSLAVSSALVLAGYTCLPVQVSGQWMWIKRAESEAEELHAIVELAVTIGQQKNPTDKIWSCPGVGWNRIDANFGKGMLSSYDAFLWFRPARARTSEAGQASPQR